MKQENSPAVTEKARLERPQVAALRAQYLASKGETMVTISRVALGELLATLDDYRTKNDKRRLETKARYTEAMRHLDTARDLMRKDWWLP
jgi:hypothetical protein